MDMIVSFSKRNGKNLPVSYLRRLCKNFGIKGSYKLNADEITKLIRIRPLDCSKLEIYAHSKKINLQDIKSDTMSIKMELYTSPYNGSQAVDVYATFFDINSVDEAVSYLIAIDPDIKLMNYIWC